jgi:HEAT repeat protein
MADETVRKRQSRFAELAAAHLPKLREVLRESLDEEHRAIAAYVIGYAPRKADVIDDLQHALRDPDDTVRNNAMRALGAIAVLAMREPGLEIKVSSTWFIEMLSSLIWSDRSTAAVNLVTLTEARDQKTLDQLRERALPALAEMARWKHLPHALPAFILLGRVAGIPEKEIQEAWAKGEREAVIGRLSKPEKK